MDVFVQMPPRKRDLIQINSLRRCLENNRQMTDSYDDLQQSYGRCLRDKHFIDNFYQELMASDPRIPAMFAHTDMGKQRIALRRGISIAILHAAGSALAKRSVEKMADVHSMHGRAPVAPEFHAHWLKSLIKVIAMTDPEADTELLVRWSRAMSVVIKVFTDRYDARTTA